MDRPIYMDHHATTPLDPRVLEAMMPYLTAAFGNASSTDHAYGVEAAKAVDGARRQVAHAIGASPREIVFTSGATEADNLALFGAAGCSEHPGHIITCATEHPAVLDCLHSLRELGWRVSELAVDALGLVDPDDVRRSVTGDTVIISIMLANNEIGTIAPIEAIAEVAREHDVLLHTDAAQAVGHIPVDVRKLGADLLSISGHKCYGPKGVGALYVTTRAKARLRPVLRGGGHERGLRPGTLNVPGIVGLGKAVELASELMDEESQRLRGLADSMFGQLAESVGAQLNGHREKRLAHNLNLHIPGVDAKALIAAVRDVAFSAGSACATAKSVPSHVLRAIGLDAARSNQSVRIGLGRGNDASQVTYAVARMSSAAKRLRRLTG